MSTNQKKRNRYRKPRLESSFSERVYDVVRTIPRGSVLSYGEVARRAGNPRAARAVGNILNKNYDPGIPCHRVIHTDGRYGGYNRGIKQKERLLNRELRISEARG